MSDHVSWFVVIRCPNCNKKIAMLGNEDETCSFCGVKLLEEEDNEQSK